MAQLMSGEVKNQNIPGLDSILRGEILRKDGLIRQLMDQNKMLLNTKERQEVEVAALNETLEVITIKVFIFTRYVLIPFVCTFHINILDNKIDLEFSSGLA